MCFPAIIAGIGSVASGLGGALGIGGAGAAATGAGTGIAGLSGAASAAGAAASGGGITAGTVLNAVSLASSGISAVSAISAGQAQAAAAQQQSRLARQAAQEVDRKSQEEQVAFYRQVAAIRGEQIASASAGGLDVGYGSPLDAQTDTTLLAREDAERLLRNNWYEKNSYLTQARGLVAEADASKTAGYAQGAQYLLGGFSRQASRNGWLTPRGGA